MECCTMKPNTSFSIILLCNDRQIAGTVGKPTKCFVCGTEVFLSDSSIRAVESQGYFKEDIEPHCFACAHKKTSQETIPTLPLTAEQKFEVTEGIKKL